MNNTTLACLVLVAASLLAPLPSRAAPQAAPAAVGAQPTVRAGAYELGVVTDVQRVGIDGIPLLAVTPGGAADRMGLKAGDRLVSVNGVRLDRGQSPSATLQAALGARGGQVAVEVLRDGRPLSVRGEADPVAAGLPSGTAGECGYVTTLGPTPRLEHNLFDAEITRIDGRSTPLQRVGRTRVDAGRRVLVVRELIPATRFDSTQLLRRERMQRQQSARAYKVLIVDVVPGVRYSVAAELLQDRMDPASIRANAYWRPVVWREVGEACP